MLKRLEEISFWRTHRLINEAVYSYYEQRSEVLRCPYCSSRETTVIYDPYVMIDDESNTPVGYAAQVMCLDCEIHGPKAYGPDTKREIKKWAIRGWNDFALSLEERKKDSLNFPS